MRHNEIRDLVFATLLIAIISILTFTMIGFINIGGVAFITIMHIPVLVGAMVLGRKYGLILGAAFGLSSLILSAILLGVNAPFTNPLLSVASRMFFGWMIYPLYTVISKRISKPSVSITLTMIISTFIHTLIVSVLLYFIGKSGFYFTASENPFTTNQNILGVLVGLFSLNGLIEIALAALVGTPAVLVLNNIRNKYAEEDREEIEEL